MIAKRLFVHLGPKEWGNELMERVARKHFADDPTLDVVEVIEHAGWWLAWLRDGTCVGTANDAATPSEKSKAFYSKLTGPDIIAGDIRRP